MYPSLQKVTWYSPFLGIGPISMKDLLFRNMVGAFGSFVPFVCKGNNVPSGVMIDIVPSTRGFVMVSKLTLSLARILR